MLCLLPAKAAPHLGQPIGMFALSVCVYSALQTSMVPFYLSVWPWQYCCQCCCKSSELETSLISDVLRQVLSNLGKAVSLCPTDIASYTENQYALVGKPVSSILLLQLQRLHQQDKARDTRQARGGAQKAVREAWCHVSQHDVCTR